MVPASLIGQGNLPWGGTQVEVETISGNYLMKVKYIVHFFQNIESSKNKENYTVIIVLFVQNSS